jgi:D-glycero-D-manno-heptose 1,7-bisphosphate phosphatase
VSEARPRAVFLDRDGTVLEERDYLADPAQVALVPGAPEAIRRLSAGGYKVVLVTNQSGIARGLYREADYRAVQLRLTTLLREAGASLDATYHCPHHPDFTGPCTCRKPGPGMYRAAERDLGVALEGSWYVGDKASDVAPARLFGGRGILVLTGYGSDWRSRLPGDVLVASDVGAAAELILGEGARNDDSR